ncbi:tc5 transposase DNA-binding domain-containing protein [Ditylenchus destructor]|nr:tc5 transposase DNA-binding domain-containing protein [Ditylenchus destructor]
MGKLSLHEKAKILDAHQNNSVRTLAKEFKISHSAVSKIVKQKDEILSALDRGLSGNRAIRQGKHEDLEKALDLWIKDLLARGGELDWPIVREKALTFAKELEIDNFVASDGWLRNFKSRHKDYYFGSLHVEVMAPRMHRSMTLLEKEMVIKAAAQKSQREVARYFGIDRTMVWISDVRAQGGPLSYDIVKKKALDFATKMNIADFKASNGWIEGFKKRSFISFSASPGGAVPSANMATSTHSRDTHLPEAGTSGVNVVALTASQDTNLPEAGTSGVCMADDPNMAADALDTAINSIPVQDAVESGSILESEYDNGSDGLDPELENETIETQIKRERLKNLKLTNRLLELQIIEKERELGVSRRTEKGVQCDEWTTLIGQILR